MLLSATIYKQEVHNGETEANFSCEKFVKNDTLCKL